MRIITIVAVAGALLATPALAQQPAASTKMTTPCPLHLTTLSLTPAQDSAFASIRAAHRAQMQAMHANAGMPHHAAGDSARRHDPAQHVQHESGHAPMHAAMQASMERSIAAARAVLTPGQVATFDAAVKAHDAEMKARMADGGTHGCADCCPEHETMHQQHHGKPAKKDG
jgi:hypothetical protein